jgi:hypothetical protein
MQTRDSLALFLLFLMFSTAYYQLNCHVIVTKPRVQIGNWFYWTLIILCTNNCTVYNFALLSCNLLIVGFVARIWFQIMGTALLSWRLYVCCFVADWLENTITNSSKNKKHSVKCDQYIKHFGVQLTCFDPKGSSSEVHQHNKKNSHSHGLCNLCPHMASHLRMHAVTWSSSWR